MEIFQLVDRAGEQRGSASRAECHGNPKLIHLVVHVHVFDPSGRVCLQKRALSKDTNPGLWDTSVGGHVSSGEDVRDAMIREAREELGIDGSRALFLYAWLSEGTFESEYAHCFRLEWEGTLRPEPGEIEAARFFTVAEVDAMVGSGVLTPMFEREWPMLLSALRIR